MKNNNYIIFEDDTTAALSPNTKIVASPRGLDSSLLKENWGAPVNSAWHLLPIGCVTEVTIAELLEMCKNPDDERDHKYVVDTILCDEEWLSLSLIEIKPTIVIK
jgi:hypothetical protein